MTNYAFQRADISKLRANVPQDMRAVPAWCLWKSELGDDPQNKPRKVPFYADGKPRGKTDTPKDRARLVIFDEVMDVYARDDQPYMGPGYALGKFETVPAVQSGMDLDNCIENGVVTAKAMQVVDAAGSYAEVSPSGNGLKIFGTGDIGTEKTPVLEIYSGGRYYTVTGNRISGDRLTDLTPAAELARAQLLEWRSCAAPGSKLDDGRNAVPAGGRNNTLFGLACSLRARSVPDDAAWEALQARNSDCIPPIPERELKAIFHRAWKYPPGFALTELGNCARLIAEHGDDLRFLIGAGWHEWNGHRFVPDRTRRVIVVMGEVARSIYAEAAATDDADRRKALAQWAHVSESRKCIQNALSLAEAQPEVADLLEHYDRDPLLIGMSNGVYDLRRNEFRDGRREDRITFSAAVAYDPAATCPRWEQFQREIHDEDKNVVAFKQRALGYTISGDISEQKLFICHGDGSNGKTTEQNIVFELLGDYASKVEPVTLLEKGREGASNDIARLRGVRFIGTEETGDGKRLAENLVKQLTGGNRLTARFLYREHFEFTPAGKIWIATNHRPEILGTDYAIWRRILLVPYPVQFAGKQRDPHLEQTLRGEASGILNWMIEGFRQWQEVGLAAPQKVIAATEQYREDMDRVGTFVRQCCKLEVKGATKTAVVYRRYAHWCEDTGGFPLAARKFHERMERDHKLIRVKQHGVEHYTGLLLIDYSRGDEIDA